MPIIKLIEIKNFRGIRELQWAPTPGINCLVGPGDSGKSTILTAIDFCLTARRHLQFSDSDFFNADVNQEIFIQVTIGDLNHALQSLEHYAMFLRGFDRSQNTVEDEPGNGLITAISLRLVVGRDLEPNWSLFSTRAQTSSFGRNLKWPDRLAISPVRLGSDAAYHLGWRHGDNLEHLQ